MDRRCGGGGDGARQTLVPGRVRRPPADRSRFPNSPAPAKPVRTSRPRVPRSSGPAGRGPPARGLPADDPRSAPRLRFPPGPSGQPQRIPGPGYVPAVLVALDEAGRFCDRLDERLDRAAWTELAGRPMFAGKSRAPAQAPGEEPPRKLPAASRATQTGLPPRANSRMAIAKRCPRGGGGSGLSRRRRLRPNGNGARLQTVSNSNPTMLRSSRPNSTPIRWTGTPGRRYLSA